MPTSRLKFSIALTLLCMVLVLVLGMVAAVGRLLLYFNSGADPAAIFQVIPAVPLDLQDRVSWQPDLPSASEGRAMEPYTRDQIAGAYLYGWAQWNISYELARPYNLKTYFSPPALEAVSQAVTTTASSGWQIRQANLHHEPALAFYADDGSIVAFTDFNAHVVHQIKQGETEANVENEVVVETTHVYDVVMRLEDGNWRIRDLVRRRSGAPLVRMQEAKPPTGFVQVEGNQLYLDGEPYTIAGINYYPKASPWTKFWPEYNAATTVADLDLIVELDLNTVRIFISYADFGGDEVAEAEIAKLLHFLNQAHARNLKVIVTIFDHHTDHHLSTWAADDRHLAGLIPPLAEHAAILAWDIKNEPDRDYDYNTQPLVDAWLRHIAGTVRRYDPNHLITIGWSQPEAAAGLTDLVDFISFHYFEATADYSTRLEKLLTAAKGKPVVLQEFVMSTWNSVGPHGHTEAEQAQYYADLLRQHRLYPTAGYMVWTLHDFDTVPLAEFRTPVQRAIQANMGLLRHDGTAKPASEIIRPGASLDLEPLASWHRWTKPFWLMILALLLVGLGMVGLLLWWWRKRGKPLSTSGPAL